MASSLAVTMVGTHVVTPIPASSSVMPWIAELSVSGPVDIQAPVAVDLRVDEPGGQYRQVGGVSDRVCARPTGS